LEKGAEVFVDCEAREDAEVLQLRPRRLMEFEHYETREGEKCGGRLSGGENSILGVNLSTFRVI